MKSITGTKMSIRVVENFASAIIANIHMRYPYIVLPVDPDMIFCGGKAKTRNTSNAPAAIIESVDEKMDSYLTAITNMRVKMVRELASIIPGEPAVHFTALIQITIQTKSMMSPGSASDCCSPKREKFQTERSRLRFKNDRFVRFITEKAIIYAASDW